MWRIEWQIYLIGLCLGFILTVGFRDIAAAVAIGVIFCILSIVGFSVKIYKFFKETNER